MMDLNKSILILASGASVPFLNSRYHNNGFKNGLDMKLETLIKNNYSIGLNFWFKYGCTTTFNASVDWQFYEDNYRDLKKLPMIIASKEAQLKNKNNDRTHENTILLKSSGIYHGVDSITKGIFSKQLVGIWGLSLAISLGFTEIYLLGFDCCEVNGKTHFYQGVVDLNKTTPIHIKGKKVNERLHFRGVGKNDKGKFNTSTYNIKKHLNNKWFAPFYTERKKIKIYNVSPESAIDIFDKIDYEQFYKQVKNNHIDQNKAREDIRRIINDSNSD